MNHPHPRHNASKQKCVYNCLAITNLSAIISNMKKGEDFTGVTIVYLCHDGKGNILLNKRSNQCRDEHGCFDPGGGGLEFGDTVVDTLKKEIWEEYCTEVLDYEFLGYRDVHREHNGKKTHWIALDFKVLVNRETVRNGEPHKFESVGWFKLDQLPTPLHSQFPLFLKLYEKRLGADHNIRTD